MERKKRIPENFIPTTEELERELFRVKYNSRYSKILRSALYSLIIAFAIAILIATLLFPVLEVYETSMSPSLEKDDVVLAVKQNSFKQGDVIAFYYNNHILVKRVIATPGDWVEFDIEGNVYVNGKILIEPYLEEKEIGKYDIEFPYMVPANSYFVLNDQRSDSLDSRNSVIGSISKEDILGKVEIRLLPLKRVGVIEK